MVIRRNCWKGRCTSSGFAQSISCLHSGLDTCFHKKFVFSGSRTCKQWKSKNIWPWPRQDLHFTKDRSLFIAYVGRGWGGKEFRGGIAENFGRIQREDYSNFLGKWRHIRHVGSDMWGGSRKSSKVIRRDYVSEVTLKGGSAKFHLV